MKRFVRILILIFLISGVVFNTTSIFSASNNVEGITDTPMSVVAGGETLGMKIYTKGVYIIGITYVETNEGRKYPAKDAGLKIGDYIVKIQDKKINSAEEFSKEMEKGGKLNATVMRGEDAIVVELVPQIQLSSGEYKMGLWVRDSTAGIGTVTYYNKADKSFGALGHGVTDMDTEKLLSIEKGYCYEAFINSVKKSEKGAPGELTANFQYLSTPDGYLTKNTDSGVFGKVSFVPPNREYEIATPDDVVEGPATIISTVEGQQKKEYTVEIIRVNPEKTLFGSGMVIKITDNELIRKTGGIVQGMSGSPIIQNGKLVGAVTHVFINDPTRGYGIFIENMLAEAEKIK